MPSAGAPQLGVAEFSLAFKLGFAQCQPGLVLLRHPKHQQLLAGGPAKAALASSAWAWLTCKPARTSSRLSWEL